MVEEMKPWAPTFHVCPEGSTDFIDGALGDIAKFGLNLDAWQQDVVRAAFVEAEDGDREAFVTKQLGVCLARQNGKGEVAIAIEVVALVALGWSIIHTAHSVKTSADAFRRLYRVFLDNPELEALIRRKSEATGNEFIELVTGARISFQTRTANTGRGMPTQLVVVDEAMLLTADQQAALLPTVFASDESLVVFLGSAPGPMHTAEAFNTMRDAAKAGLNPHLAWFEWCSPVDVDPADVDAQVRVNPAVASGRVPLANITNDLSTLAPDVFLVERMSVWRDYDVTDVGGFFTVAQWDACLNVAAKPADRSPLVIGVDVSRTTNAATIALAGLTEDKHPFVEVYAEVDSPGAVPAKVADMLANDSEGRVVAVLVDEGGEAAGLDWKAEGLRPHLLSMGDVTAATAVVTDAIRQAEVRHTGQASLSTGVLNSAVRPLRGGAAWDRKGAGSSALIAASFALLGVDGGCRGRRFRSPLAGAGRARPRVNPGRPGRAEPRRSRMSPRERYEQAREADLARAEEHARKRLGARADDPAVLAAEVQRLVTLAGGL